MTSALRHRGPDAEGIWTEPGVALALGHRRLAIVDLSPAGEQPMQSSGGRFWIVFNGEVYNFRQLRTELEALGVRVDRASDTAVMLAAFERWGVAASVPKFHGMFAFAVWDSAERCLWLGRDRLGEKPLYFAEYGEGLAFASELKAVVRAPGFPTDIDSLAVADVLGRGCTRGRRTIYAAAKKLLPGQLARFWQQDAGHSSEFTTYWSVSHAMAVASRVPELPSDTAALDVLDDLLTSVVRDEMISDVPLGAFLSGGIDSSLIVALMQRVAGQPVRTFTIGFEEATHDESPFAQAVAAHLGTRHTEVRLSATDALDVVPRLSEIFDEPFADSSQLPTLLVSSVTRQHVTVALSGDGGDELFGGYSQYVGRDSLAALAARIPGPLRSVATLAAHVAPDWALTRGSHTTWPPNLRHRLQLLIAPSPRSAHYDSLLSKVVAPRDVLARSPGDPGFLQWPEARTDVEAMMGFDLQTYLPDDILVKVDRSAMACSLETRAPLLDHRVVEFALAQPLRRKIRDGRGKFLLRQLLLRYVPLHLVDRPKRGFAIPLAQWLRGELRDWGADMLANDATLREWFRPNVVASLWSEHQRGADRSEQLWPVLMILQWLRAARTR